MAKKMHVVITSPPSQPMVRLAIYGTQSIERETSFGTTWESEYRSKLCNPTCSFPKVRGMR